MTPHTDGRTMIVVKKMQDGLEGEANDAITGACSFVIANAAAILAQDRADAERILKKKLSWPA